MLLRLVHAVVLVVYFFSVLSSISLYGCFVYSLFRAGYLGCFQLEATMNEIAMTMVVCHLKNPFSSLFFFSSLLCENSNDILP